MSSPRSFFSLFLAASKLLRSAGRLRFDRDFRDPALSSYWTPLPKGQESASGPPPVHQRILEAFFGGRKSDGEDAPADIPDDHYPMR